MKKVLIATTLSFSMLASPVLASQKFAEEEAPFTLEEVQPRVLPLVAGFAAGYLASKVVDKVTDNAVEKALDAAVDRVKEAYNNFQEERERARLEKEAAKQREQ